MTTPYDLSSAPFEPVNPDFLPAAFDWLAANSKRGGTAVYTWIQPDGMTLASQPGTACHGSLLPGNLAPVTCTRARHYGTDPAIHERFMDFVVKRSPFSRFILAPSFEDARDHGFVIEGDVPFNLVMAACHLSRFTGENAEVAKQFVALVDAFPELPERAAFVLALSGIGPTGWTGIGGPRHGSPILAGSLSYVQSFERGIAHRVGSTYRTPGASYMGVTNTWNGDPRSMNLAGLVNELKGLIPKPSVKKETGPVVPNPFARVATHAYEGIKLSKDELKSIIPLLMEYLNRDEQPKLGQISHAA